MDYFIYGRADLAASAEDNPALDEAHWSYMDAFADRMIARGPTLSPDRGTWTGSLHVVALNSGTAEEFAMNEPYQRAGMFKDHLIRRFDNLLGRTMWDIAPDAEGVPFLAMMDAPEVSRWRSMARSGLSPDLAERLVMWGALGPEGVAGGWTGMVLGLLASDEAAAHALIAADSRLLAASTPWQIHAWEFGGRR